MYILVVGQGIDILQSTRNLLSLAGHCVKTVRSGVEVLSLYPLADVIVSASTSEPDDIELLNFCKKRRPGLQIITLSDSHDLTDTEFSCQGSTLEALVLTRPFNQTQLLSIVAQCRPVQSAVLTGACK